MRRQLLPIALILLCLWLFPIRSNRNVPAPTPLRLVPDNSITLYAGNQACAISLESYVAGAVAAEMPTSWHEEALKAQAVAARTYALQHVRSRGGSGCLSHADCDLCTDPNCCQAYSAQPDQFALQAAAATQDEVLTYEGEIILALYHAASGGQTEDVESVFSEALPYLRSVKSPGEENCTPIESSAFYSINDLEKLSGQKLQSPLSGCLSVLSRTASGRAAVVKIGNKSYTGREFRALLSLPSCLFDFSFESDSSVRITSLGRGHGVGMSQTGAQAMAQNGSSYRDILTHYYTGCTISRCSG